MPIPEPESLSIYTKAQADALFATKEDLEEIGGSEFDPEISPLRIGVGGSVYPTDSTDYIGLGDISVVGNRAIAIGKNATSGPTPGTSDTTAVGNNSVATGDEATALGYSALAVGAQAVGLGASSTASGDEATAVGYSAQGTGE